jgi:hypothetical protein
MIDHAPQGALIRFEPDGQLVELFIQALRVERRAAGSEAVLGAPPLEEVFKSSDLAL